MSRAEGARPASPAREAEAGHCTLLIVDDSPEDRETYKTYLSVGGPLQFTFLEAEDLASAARLLSQAEVDCMLLDQALPDGNGTDLIDRVRAEHDRDRLPIIMITGRGSEKVAVTAMKRGAVDYLPKDGMGAEALRRAVRHACQLREMAARLAEESYARRLAEHALHAQELSLRALFESIEQVAIVTLDAAGHVVSWNHGARRLFDFHDRDIIGRHADVLAAAREQGGGIRAQMLAAGDGGRPNQQRWFRRQGGVDFLGASVLSKISDPRSGLRGYAWVVQAVDPPEAMARP